MGSALATREGTPLVEGMPTDQRLLAKELRELTKELRVRQRLRGWTDALRTLPTRNIKGFKWLLLVLDLEANTIKVTGFADRQMASQAVAKLEQLKSVDAVLVWVKSVKYLKVAYPNYYADTRGFIDAVNVAVRP